MPTWGYPVQLGIPFPFAGKLFQEITVLEPGQVGAILPTFDNAPADERHPYQLGAEVLVPDAPTSTATVPAVSAAPIAMPDTSATRDFDTFVIANSPDQGRLP